MFTQVFLVISLVYFAIVQAIGFVGALKLFNANQQKLDSARIYAILLFSFTILCKLMEW